MATYSDYQQRLLDQGRPIEEVRQHRNTTAERWDYKDRVMALDPKAKLRGPFRVGHYTNYIVEDGDGRQIGWTEGNEQGEANAWLRAYSTLTRGVA